MQEFLELFYGRLGKFHYMAAVDENEPLLPFVVGRSGVMRFSMLRVNPYAIGFLHEACVARLQSVPTCPHCSYTTNPRIVAASGATQIPGKSTVSSGRIVESELNRVVYMTNKTAITAKLTLITEAQSLQDKFITAIGPCTILKCLTDSGEQSKHESDIQLAVGTAIATMVGRVKLDATIVLLSVLLRTFVWRSIEEVEHMFRSGSSICLVNRVLVSLEEGGRICLSLKNDRAEHRRILSDLLHRFCDFPLKCVGPILSSHKQFLCKNLLEVADDFKGITARITKSMEANISAGYSSLEEVQHYLDILASNNDEALEQYIDRIVDIIVMVGYIPDSRNAMNQQISWEDAKQQLNKQLKAKIQSRVAKEAELIAQATVEDSEVIASVWAISWDEIQLEENTDKLIELHDSIKELCTKESVIKKSFEEIKSKFNALTALASRHINHVQLSADVKASYDHLAGNYAQLPERIAAMQHGIENIRTAVIALNSQECAKCKTLLIKLFDAHNSAFCVSDNPVEINAALDNVLIDYNDIEPTIDSLHSRSVAFGIPFLLEVENNSFRAINVATDIDLVSKIMLQMQIYADTPTWESMKDLQDLFATIVTTQPLLEPLLNTISQTIVLSAN